MTEKKRIDLRSDTVTRPTDEMRQAMATAVVGDDVFLEDPTAARLEEIAAETLGKEAAIFMPTGTMGNQVAINLHTRPGNEVIVEAQSHVLNYELAGMTALSGVLPRPVAAPRGILSRAQVEKAIRPDIYYLPRTGLICLENTHNLAGGTIFPREEMDPILELARQRKIPVHLDGARIFNAASATGVSAASLAEGADSVMFCLSKGLGAPAGSMLCGPAPFIEEARRVRKRFGGGMRQVGVLGAAGIIALTRMVDRLPEDHENARTLALRLSEIDGIEIDPEEVDTNIIMFSVTKEGWDAPHLCLRLEEKGILSVAFDRERIRVVTHFDVSEKDCVGAAETVAKLLQGRG
jgi:threonine aldolase